MAKYPLIQGNTEAIFDLTDANGHRNSADAAFDIYIYKNDNDTVTRAYAIVTLKNIGDSGSLNFANIRLKDADGGYHTTYSGYTINPTDSNGNIYIGQQDGISGGSGNKTIAQGSETMGTDGFNDDASSRWLKITSTGDLEDSVNSSDGSTSLGVSSSFRVVPIYTTTALKANGIPSNSWATFVLAFAPAAVGDGAETSLVIESNAEETVIPLFGTAFNEVIIGLQRGDVTAGEFSQVGPAIEDQGILNLGYKGVVTTIASPPDPRVIKLSDISAHSESEDFNWTSQLYQSSASAWIPDGTQMSDPPNHSFGSLYPTYSKQASSWTTDIDSLEAGTNNHAFDGSSKAALYKKFLYPSAALSNGTLNNNNNTAWDYDQADFKLYQWSTVFWDLDGGGTDSFSFVTTAGVYHRLTLPYEQWQASGAYNEVKGDLYYTTLKCDDSNDVCEGGGSVTIPLTTNLIWNNWAGAASGVDSGMHTEFSANGFPMLGEDFEDTNCNLYSADDVTYTDPATQSFTNFTGNHGKSSCFFKYFATPNITFKELFNYNPANDNNCAANTNTRFGIIEGKVYPDVSSTFWNGTDNYPHMVRADENFYNLSYWPKRDVLTLHQKTLDGSTTFSNDTACPGYASGTGLSTSESGGISVTPVEQWYNSLGEELTNLSGATFTDNNTSVTHPDTEPVSNVYSGDGGKIYSNNNNTYINSGGAKTGFNSFVDVLGLETNFTAYNENRIFNGGNAYKKHIRTKTNGLVSEFVPNNNIYDLGTAQLHATDGEYRAHGIFKLGNPGHNIIWIHSIHTEKAYMYEIDISNSTNNGKADYGYMPNQDSTSGAGPTLEFFTEAGASTLWREKKAYYSTNVNGVLPADSASKFNSEIGKYYVGVGSSKAHFILPDFGANDGTPVAPPSYSALPGLNYNSTNLMTYTLYGADIRAGGGGDIYVRMIVPSDSNVDDLGDYRMALKVTYMVHDWGNTKYNKQEGESYISTSHLADVEANENGLSIQKQQALRLKEATFIFKMTVDTEAEIEVTDQEGDGVDAGIDFGQISLG